MWYADKKKKVSICDLTFNKFTPVGFLREKTPEVCDARDCDGQKLLYDNQGLLLCENLIRQQLSILHVWDKLITDWVLNAHSQQLAKTLGSQTVNSCIWRSEC